MAHPPKKDEESTSSIPQKILGALSDSSKTIGELSAATGIHRVTISKHASVLHADGKLDCKSIGKAKIYSLKADEKKEAVVVAEKKPTSKEKKTAAAAGKKERNKSLDAAVRSLIAVELFKKKVISEDEMAQISGVREETG